MPPNETAVAKPDLHFASKVTEYMRRFTVYLEASHQFYGRVAREPAVVTRDARAWLDPARLN